MLTFDRFQQILKVCLLCAVASTLLCFSVKSVAQDWNPICVSCIPQYHPDTHPNNNRPNNYHPNNQPQNNQPDPQIEATNWKNAGSDAYNRGDWATAINDFQKALQYAPNDSTLQQWLQAAQNQQAQAQAAADAAQRAAQLAAQQQAIQQAQQNAESQAQADASRRANTLSDISNDVSDAEQAKAQGDWQRAKDDYQSALYDDQDNSALEGGLEQVQGKIKQAFLADRVAAARKLEGPGISSLQPLQGGLLDNGQSGSLQPLQGDPLNATATGNSSALGQLRSIAASSKKAAEVTPSHMEMTVNLDDDAALGKALSNLGFDTTGVPASGAFDLHLTSSMQGGGYEISSTKAYQALPLATRDNPEFKKEFGQYIQAKVELAQMQHKESIVQQQIDRAPTVDKKWELQKVRLKLIESEWPILGQEDMARTDTFKNFNVNVTSMLSIKPAAPSIVNHPLN